MATTILRALTVPEIRKKLAFTALLLALYRVGSHIPVPGIDVNAVNQIQRQFGNGGILNLLNTFSGGGLSRIALFALGIMPYITASVIPSFDTPHVFLIVISLTAGTVLLMWMGELITQRGIGNGISLMIFASIVSRIPAGVNSWWTNPDQVFRVIMPFIAVAVVAAVVFVQEGQRRIPVQYAKRVIGRRMTEGTQTYLPLRVNMAGVIPVIFAASIMAFPPTLGELIPGARGLSTFFSPNGWAYVVGETVFIILFTYFYTAVTFNPVDQADNLRKYGGFIPG